MSRPPKKALEFYSSDTDRYQDIKIRRLNKEFGCKGISVWDYILNEIYKEEGSYIIWDDNVSFIVAEFFKDISEEEIKSIVQFCCEVNLFDKSLFKKHKVLTSVRIQNQYHNICKISKRVKTNIPVLYDLIGFNTKETKLSTEETKLSTEETKLSTEEMPQSKLKGKLNIKEKEKENIKEKEKSENALRFLYDNFNNEYKRFESDYKGKILDWKRFCLNFNDTMLEEKKDYSIDLFPRLRKYARNWISNQKEIQNKPENPYSWESGKLPRVEDLNTPDRY